MVSFSSFIPIGEDVEQELTTGTIEWNKSELVDDQELDALQALLESPQLSLVSRFEKISYEI